MIFLTRDVVFSLAVPSGYRGGNLRYFFEDFSLDTNRRELRRGAELVRVEPQVFDILEYLIRNRDHLVSKDDLIAAVWEGRVVSESALTSRINAARSAVGDSGERQQLIKTVPRKGVRFVGAVREASERAIESVATLEQNATRFAIPDKPSIAVLPFANLSGDLQQDYFTDGIVEDIITGLSRMGWLFVIARNSSFTYKGRAVDVKQVGRELGVRYILEGTLRKAANKVRITAQLVDASSGAQLSADRFDGMLEDIFDLQDQVTSSVVGAISRKLEKAEIARATRKPTESLDAYDHYLRGMACIYQWTNESHNEALRFFGRAIEIDQEFASAYGMAARCYNWRAANGWMTDKAEEVAAVRRLSRRAVDLGKDEPIALYTAGHAIARILGDLDVGANLIDRALVLNPNLAAAWLASGWVRVWIGEPDEAIKRLAHAMRLSPIDPQAFSMQAGTATAHFIAGRYDEASQWVENALSDQPNFCPALRIAASIHSLMGRNGEARTLLRRLLEIDPAMRASNIKDRVPWRREQDLAVLVRGLRTAGLPE